MAAALAAASPCAALEVDGLEAALEPALEASELGARWVLGPEASPQSAAAVLRSEGVVVLRQALGASQASALDGHVGAVLAEAAARAALSAAEEAVNFGAVLCKHRRFDLKLSPGMPPVDAALRALLAQPRVRQALAQVLGEDAELYELAAMVSDPGARRQPVHPDTPFPETRRGAAPEEAAQALPPVVITAFLALQDITPAMGPTVLWSRTHTPKAHAEWYEHKSAFLQRSACRVGLLSRGDLLLFDSRLLHCGGANLEGQGQRRVLFYFSLKAKDARGLAPGTLRGALRGRYRGLDSLCEKR